MLYKRIKYNKCDKYDMCYKYNKCDMSTKYDTCKSPSNPAIKCIDSLAIPSE